MRGKLTVLGAATLIAAIGTVGCQTAAFPRGTHHRPANTRQHDANEIRRITARKPSLDSHSATLVPQSQRLELLFAAHDRLQRDVELFLTRLQRRLPQRDAAHVTTLHRIYSTGRFLRELTAWSDDTGKGLLTREDQQQLQRLLERRVEWESLMVAVARSPQSNEPR